MTWVDLAVLGVLAISALLAFIRGFAREVLGIGAWVGAILAAVWAFPYARPHVRNWLGAPDLVDPVTFGAVFIVVLLILLVISSWIGSLVRRSVLGGLDRTLGLVFGLVRGAAVVVIAYIAAGTLVPVDRWPEPVLRRDPAGRLSRRQLGRGAIAPRIPPARSIRRQPGGRPRRPHCCARRRKAARRVTRPCGSRRSRACPTSTILGR